MATAPRSGSRYAARLVLWLLLFGSAAIVALLLYAWWRPLDTVERFGRATLRLQGFSRTEVPRPHGAMAYFEKGDGPLLLFVHGANDQAGAWARIAPRYADRYHVVVMDLAGHGASGPASGPLTAADLVDGVAAVVAAERGDEPAVLVGNSLGGFLALVQARRHPGEVAHVVLANGAITSGDGSQASVTLLPRTREEARAAFAAITSPASSPMPAFVLDDVVRRAAKSPLARLADEPAAGREAYTLDGVLEQIDVPVSMIWGVDDRVLPLSYAEQAQARFPRAALLPIPNCGHVPQRECADAFAARLDAALASPPAAGAEGVSSPEGVK
jgi:pyruvate dehydrogenase E2 component (dihydrolipoamide acetyltransferase)